MLMTLLAMAAYLLYKFAAIAYQHRHELRGIRSFRELFWPCEAPSHDAIKRMVAYCPMPWPDLGAVANKRQFIWRFAYWLHYQKLTEDNDIDNARAYWQLIIDSNDPDFWRAMGDHRLGKPKVGTILHCLLTDKKLPTQG